MFITHLHVLDLIGTVFANFCFRSGYMMSEHQSLLKKALFVLSSRIKLSSKSQPGFQELLKYAVVASFLYEFGRI